MFTERLPSTEPILYIEVPKPSEGIVRIEVLQPSVTVQKVQIIFTDTPKETPKLTGLFSCLCITPTTVQVPNEFTGKAVEVIKAWLQAEPGTTFSEHSLADFIKLEGQKERFIGYVNALVDKMNTFFIDCFKEKIKLTRKILEGSVSARNLDIELSQFVIFGTMNNALFVPSEDNLQFLIRFLKRCCRALNDAVQKGEYVPTILQDSLCKTLGNLLVLNRGTEVDYSHLTCIWTLIKPEMLETISKKFGLQPKLEVQQLEVQQLEVQLLEVQPQPIVEEIVLLK